MSEEGFSGFERSAPKSIPSTRVEGEPPKKKKKKKRRRVENDPPMVKGMVIPNVKMATPVHEVTPAAPVEEFSLDDPGNGAGALFEEAIVAEAVAEAVPAEAIAAMGPSMLIEPEPVPAAIVPEAVPAVATDAEADAGPKKKRKRVSDDPPRNALRDASAVAENSLARPRLESAWDAAPGTPNSDLAKAFVDHTEAMLDRILEKQMEIVRLQQKVVDQLKGASDDSEFNKKDAVFVGLVLFVIAAFALMFALKNY